MEPSLASTLGRLHANRPKEQIYPAKPSLANVRETSERLADLKGSLTHLTNTLETSPKKLQLPGIELCLKSPLKLAAINRPVEAGYGFTTNPSTPARVGHAPAGSPQPYESIGAVLSSTAHTGAQALSRTSHYNRPRPFCTSKTELAPHNARELIPPLDLYPTRMKSRPLSRSAPQHPATRAHHSRPRPKHLQPNSRLG